jgi:hypothetical protein
MTFEPAKCVISSRNYEDLPGGTDNYEVDRRGSDRVEDTVPGTLPESRVVYVDIDPVVLACGHVKAQLAENNSTAFIEADASDVGRILSHPDTQRLVNFDEPVAVH